MKKQRKISIKARLLGSIMPVVIAIVAVLVLIAYQASAGIIEDYSQNLLESSVSNQSSKIEAWLSDSNIGGLIAYIYHGNVLFLLGIPAAICSILGNYIGTKMAIKIGGKFIRPVLLTAMGLLDIKLIWDTLS